MASYSHVPMQRSQSATTPRHARGVRRVALIVVGSVALVMGAVGIILPLLPATPLVLLSAACFAASWPAMHHRLAQSRVFGSMLQSPDIRHLPRRTKVAVTGFTLVSIGATAVLAAKAPWLRLSLAAIAVVVTYVIWRIPSKPRGGVSE